ncbi:MAG: HXXEE domain-containing protein [Rikenellaceae bacterium]|nr:HXXEE domain-containing protein [Rikenellaceae bacterium]
MKKTMQWLYDNWMKATPFLVIYVSILLWLYVKEQNYALFLIWMQTPLYWLHEFEEYICPGGFLSFFNQNMMRCKREDYPMTTVGSFWINIPLVYILLPLSGLLSHFYGIEWGLWTAFFSFLNAFSHDVMFLIFGRKYNPGLIVSTFVNVPYGIYMIWYFLSNHLVSNTVIVWSIVFGIMAQASMMIYAFAFLVPKIKREGLRK